MLWGHASHQVGLDADVWLTPMPEAAVFAVEARETMMATSVVRADRRDIDPAVWTPAHARLVELAAREPRSSGCFVNAAIKEGALPRHARATAPGSARLRPMLVHDYHVHACPVETPAQKQTKPSAGRCSATTPRTWCSRRRAEPSRPAAAAAPGEDDAGTCRPCRSDNRGAVKPSTTRARIDRRELSYAI